MARVLVVVDEPTDRLILETILGDAGHDVRTVRDGDAAFRACLRGDVDLIVTDLDDRDLHGYELISSLQDIYPRPAVVAVSGSSRFEVRIAQLLGAHAALPSPVEAASLVEAVEEALLVI